MEQRGGAQDRLKLVSQVLRARGHEPVTVIDTRMNQSVHQGVVGVGCKGTTDDPDLPQLGGG